MGDVSDIQCIDFQKDLEKKLRGDKSTGTVDEVALRVNCDFMEICFVSDQKSDAYYGQDPYAASIDEDDYPLKIELPYYDHNYIDNIMIF